MFFVGRNNPSVPGRETLHASKENSPTVTTLQLPCSMREWDVTSHWQQVNDTYLETEFSVFRADGIMVEVRVTGTSW